MDVSDIIDYNVSTLNFNDLANSFFCLSKDDPTVGFSFDATHLAGPTYPQMSAETLGKLCVAGACGALQWRVSYISYSGCKARAW